MKQYSYLFQRPPKMLVIVLIKGIQIFPHSTREESWILGYYGDVPTDVVQAQLLDVDAVNTYDPGRFRKPEERSQHGRLTSTRPAHDANL